MLDDAAEYHIAFDTRTHPGKLAVTCVTLQTRLYDMTPDLHPRSFRLALSEHPLFPTLADYITMNAPIRPVTDFDLPRAAEVWRHYKGELYAVVTLSQRERNHDTEVVYRSLATGKTYHRPLREWTEPVWQGDTQVPRFTRETSA